MYTLDWLFPRQRMGIKVGLERTQALLARLGHPERRFKSVLIGGTNGKGSTAATLANIIQAEGEQVALFTSPHLVSFAERFQVNGVPLPMEQVLAALAHIGPEAEAVEASFFEIVTALGCYLFAQAQVDWAVMEVGMGGRFDSTNALAPELSVITSIGLDHTEYLGDTEALIAFEKAGILRAGQPAITAVSGEGLAVIRAQAQQLGSELWCMGQELQLTTHSLGWGGWGIEIHSPWGELDLSTPLLGQHQAHNVALAAVAAQRLGFSLGAIRVGAAATRWPGRLEVCAWQGGTVLLDGAHNLAGAHALVAAVQHLGLKPVPLIVGFNQDKDIAALLAVLSAIASEIIFTRAVHTPRAADPASLPAFLPAQHPPYRITHSPAEALAALPQGPAILAGSLYLVGEVRSLLREEAPEGRERWQ